MKSYDRTRALLAEHYKKYPLIEIRDLFKYLYQSAFGCEHLVSSLERVTEYIKIESEAMPDSTDKEPSYDNLIDRLDGEYSRVHLEYLKHGIDAEMLGKLFLLSAKTETNGREKLEEKLGTAREMIREGALPFSLSDFERELDAWRKLGYPPIHHSEAFRKEYRPAYRVIANEYVNTLPPLPKADK